MKSFFNFLAAVLIIVISLSLVNSVYAQNSVTGIVKFSDNNQIATSGSVKAYKVADNSLIGIATINPDGSYNLVGLPGEPIDIIGFPNHEWGEDSFVPTYYPSNIDWNHATQIVPNGYMNGEDIYVFRTASSGGSMFTSTISGNVILDNKALDNAIIYAMQGESYKGFGVTDSKGNYVINKLPLGNYILVVHRMGCTSAKLNVTLTANGLSNINFTLSNPSKIQNNSIKGGYKLNQNFPNPFNPVTKISYIIPKDGLVRLAVFTISGQLVKELVNEYRTAGEYSADFDGSSLASGVYFYTMNIGDFVQTKKLTLIK